MGNKPPLARRYVYIWADGVYLQARMEPEAECILVIIGATPEGRKELLGFHAGTRESAQSWREFLVELKARGLAVAPEIAVGDGALGFWKALDEVLPGTRHQRCWVHKIANVLNKMPKSMAPAVKSDLRDVWQAETRSAAEAAMDTFAEKYGTKYDKAAACLTRDREALLAFFDFPAEHWDHLRTANPIESVFATVRHRTIRTKGALSQKTAKLMVFTLIRAASKKWRRLKGANQLPLVVDGVTFADGVAAHDAETRAAAASPRFSHSSGGARGGPARGRPEQSEATLLRRGRRGRCGRIGLKPVSLRRTRCGSGRRPAAMGNKPPLRVSRPIGP
jgi:putative transposase